MIRKVFYYLTHWETWHWFAKYIIIGPAWVWLCIKAKSLWFFSNSNPGIDFGGFLGETKSQIYEALPDGSYPKSIYIKPGHSFDRIDQALAVSGLQYPLAVKPDAGMMGFMFRKVESRHQLQQYHSAMQVNYIIQEFIQYPVEVSVFYYRLPGEATGHITGLVRKELMSVTGDGVTTLKDLISKYQRAQFRLKELFSKHQANLDTVIPNGEEYILSDALNLSRGGMLVNIIHEKDKRLTHLFDRFSHHGNFYYGRYDIRCNSIEELKEGRKFSILEFNGCGGEAHHVYSGYSFFGACVELIRHWNMLYQVSMRQKANGIKLWNYAEGAEYLRKAREHFRALSILDNKFSFAKEIPKTLPAPVEAYHAMIGNKDFPCIAAKAASSRDQIRIMVCDHLACPKDDAAITKFIHAFVDEYRSTKNMYTSAVIIFEGPTECSEEHFDMLMWQRLQSIADIDADQHPWNKAIGNDPTSPNFSFCIKEEPFYVIGLHRGSSRKARQFQYPAIVFNPHDQFERLRVSNKYSSMKKSVRKRDEVFSGSVNPMLSDFGDTSEVLQYSGRVYDKTWTCPFHSNHAKD